MLCCEDHSETTVTTVSTAGTMSTQVTLSSLEAKVIKVMAENSRLRSEVKRQASIASKAIEELGNTVQKLQKAIADNQRQQEMEARLKALEKIVVGGERAKTRSSSRHASLPDLSAHLESNSPLPMAANQSGNASVGSTRSRKSRTRKSSSPDLSCHIAKTSSSHNTTTTSGCASVGSASSRRSSKSTSTKSKTKRSSTANKAIAETLQHLEMEISSSNQPSTAAKSSTQGDMSMHMSHMSFGNLDWDFDDSTSPATQDEEFPILSTSMSGSQHFHSNHQDTAINADKSECETTDMNSPSKSKSKRRHSKHETESPADSPKASRKQTPMVKQKSALIWTPERAQELCQPFTPQEMAAEQTKDKALSDNLVNGGMYPKFCMSVGTVKDSENELYLFTKCVYVPEHLRQRTMEHYYRKNGGENWSREMCRHKIWPTIDADITNFCMVCKK